MNKNDNNINIHIGQVIRIYRKLHKLTLAELSESMNISYQQLQKYEKGTNKISADKLFQLSKLLKINPIEFFPGHTSQTAKQDRQQREISHIISSIDDDIMKKSLLEFLGRMRYLQSEENLNYSN